MNGGFEYLHSSHLPTLQENIFCSCCKAESTKACLHLPRSTRLEKNKRRWFPQQPQRFIFTNLFWSVLPSQVLEPVEPALVAPKLPGTFSGTFSGTLLNLTWLCTKTSQTFTGTFSGTLNLKWLCTKASQTFSGTLSGTLLNLTCMALHTSLQDLLRNLLRYLPEPSPEPSPEPCWT